MTLSQEYLAEIQLTDYREHDSPRWLVVCRYTANPSGAPKDDTSLLVEMNYNSSLVSQTSVLPLVFNQFIIDKASNLHYTPKSSYNYWETFRRRLRYFQI
jgi:hypothetical protein